MQQIEEAQQMPLQKFDLDEEYFAPVARKPCLKEDGFLTVEKYLASVLEDGVLESPADEKYVLSLHQESSFSTPEPFSPKSHLTTESDTSCAITEVRRDVDRVVEEHNLDISKIQNPEPECKIKSERSSPRLRYSIFSWSVQLSPRSDEKKNPAVSNLYLSLEVKDLVRTLVLQILKVPQVKPVPQSNKHVPHKSVRFALMTENDFLLEQSKVVQKEELIKRVL